MVQVEILLRAVPTNDGFTRYFGFIVDEPLPATFWNNRPKYVVKETNKAWSRLLTYDLPEGPHYLEFGCSSQLTRYWTGFVSINGELLVNGQRIDSANFIHLNFYVGEVPPNGNGNGNGNGTEFLRQISWMLLAFVVGGVLAVASKES